MFYFMSVCLPFLPVYFRFCSVYVMLFTPVYVLILFSLRRCYVMLLYVYVCMFPFLDIILCYCIVLLCWCVVFVLSWFDWVLFFLPLGFLILGHVVCL